MPYKKLLCLLQLVLSQVPPFALCSQPELPPLQARLPPTPRTEPLNHERWLGNASSYCSIASAHTHARARTHSMGAGGRHRPLHLHLSVEHDDENNRCCR